MVQRLEGDVDVGVEDSVVGFVGTVDSIRDEACVDGVEGVDDAVCEDT